MRIGRHLVVLLWDFARSPTSRGFLAGVPPHVGSGCCCRFTSLRSLKPSQIASFVQQRTLMSSVRWINAHVERSLDRHASSEHFHSLSRECSCRCPNKAKTRTMQYQRTVQQGSGSSFFYSTLLVLVSKALPFSLSYFVLPLLWRFLFGAAWLPM